MLAETNFILFLGRLHPLMVHLPIGFLALLAAVELAARTGRFKQVGHARGIILFGTVVSSAAAVVFGLMLASGGQYDAGLLTLHKWLGIGLAVLICIAGIAYAAGKTRVYLGLLVTALAVMMPASHMGGSMTHGKEYLTEYAPSWLGGRPAGNVASQLVAVTDPLQAKIYRDLVAPALQRNCVACHGAEKSSGGLRLDSVEAIRRGGKSGAATVSGDAMGSLLVQRMRLPMGDVKRMPPEGRRQPSSDEMLAISWWIDAGMPEELTVAEVEAGAEQLDATARLLKLPVPTGSSKPSALTEIAGVVAELGAKTGAQVAPLAVGEPWLSVNAAVAPRFGDAELKSLAAIRNNIVTLNLARTGVSAEGLETVGQMGNLRELRLDGTRIDDAGLKQLARLRKLEYLNLYGTPVTNGGLSALKGLPSLRRVYLWQTKVTAEATTRFAEARTDVAKIESLKKQIADLQVQLAKERIEVVGGVAATTQSATQPSIRAATQSTSRSSTQPATVPATHPSSNPSTAPVTKPSTQGS